MILFLTGPINSGKTSCLLALADKLITDGIKVGGVISVKKFAKGKRLYYALNVNSLRYRKLLEVENGKIKQSKAGFLFAARAISAAKKCEVVIIDEFGPLELAGRGYFKEVKKIIAYESKVIIIVVREELFNEVYNLLQTTESR